MDLTNLINVQYQVNLDQNKLQQVLKSLNNKLNKTNQTCEDLTNKYKILSEQNNHIIERQNKFEQFTINNFKATANEFSELKESLKKQLGQKWSKQQQIKSSLNSTFNSQLNNFQQQKNKLNNKLSQLKIQIVKKSQYHDGKTEQVKEIIRNQNQTIREQIKNVVEKRISSLQKEIEVKNQEFMSRRISKIDQNIIKLAEQNDFIRATINSSEYNRSQASLKRLNSSSSSNKFSRTKQDQALNNEASLNQQKKSNKQLIKENQVKQREINEQQLKQLMKQEQQKSLQHLIQTLKNQINQNIRNQIMQFQSALSSLVQKNNKFENVLQNLQSDQKNMGDGLNSMGEKMSDIKNQIQNLKNSIYDCNQKSRKVADKCLDQEDKINQVNVVLENIKMEFNQRINQCSSENQGKKIRQIQNFNRTNQNYKNNINRTTIHSNSAHLEQNFWVNKLNIINERISKIQQKFRNNGILSDSNLPRINSSTNLTVSKGNNTPSVDLLKKDVQKTNEQLQKTNQRLQTLKKNLKQFQTTHSVIPKKIQNLQLRMTQLNQLQQDRLLELIKQLINRVLTDPFNNNFTNTLKKQIHIKFLEIKHQYASIWKQIQSKVSDRAQIKQLQNLKENVQNKDLEIKALVNKKADTEDFKKATKYLQGKIKQIYAYLKGEEDKNKNKKEYFMGKK